MYLVYEGDPADPMAQTVRSVEASSIEEAYEKNPRAICIQFFEEKEDSPSEKALKRGIKVWT